MNLKIDDDKCIGCGSCFSLTNFKIFDFNDEGRAYVKSNEVSADDEENVNNAIQYCPTAAISNEE